MNRAHQKRKNFENFELTPIIIDKVGYSIGCNWKRFGRQLGLSEIDLDHIDNDNQKTYEKAVNVLEKWKQKNKNLFWGNLKKKLESFEHVDVIEQIEKVFINQYISADENDNTRRTPHGCIFIIDSNKDECLSTTKVELQLHHEHNNWQSISNKKNQLAYYLTKNKENKLYIKIENLFYEDQSIHFRFSFQNSNGSYTQKDFLNIIITGSCNYEFTYNGIKIATPEPIFENNFNTHLRPSNNLDWRNVQNIHLYKVPPDKSLEMCALDYIDRNFTDCNDLIYVPSMISDENFIFVVSKFYDLFAKNGTDIRAILPGYSLHYHASLLKCIDENFRNCNNENRITIFYSEYNLIFITRIASSLDFIKPESENCLNDIKLFVNIHKPLIEDKELIILGVVVLPLFERKKLKQELFFQFSESFDLDQVLFLCKDDFEDENFDCWWRSVVAYCIKKINEENNYKILFKQLIGLTMMAMAKVDYSLPTLEYNTQKQIKSLILSVEQRNAINSRELKKIITGGYGSGKSLVAKEIVKNCLTKISETPFTLYYICCNYFSLFECEMKEFVDNIEKTSNATVVCNNLYELWKNMSQKENLSEKYISLPKLLEYLANTHNNQVNFVLEELPEEYVKEEEAVQIKNLLMTLLKDSLVVFIPESITKNRELITYKKRCILQRNCFQEEIIGMKVISLNKSMRVTECNKLLLDSAQETISKSKTVLNVPQIKNKKNYSELVSNKRLKRQKRFFEKKEPIQNEQISLFIGDPKIETKDDSECIFLETIKSELKVLSSLDQTEKLLDNQINEIPVSYIPNKLVNDHASEINEKIIESELKDGLTNTEKLLENKTNDFDVGLLKVYNLDQFSNKTVNQTIDKTVNYFHDYDLDQMAKIVAQSNKNIDPNRIMETGYFFKSSNIGHSIKGEKPKVVYFPFHDITQKQSTKFLSVVLESICFKIVRKTVVICNNTDEVQSVAYAIDIIRNYKAVTFSPHLQKYSPSLKEKMKVKKKLRNDFDILVTDCKGFSGAESESVIVLANPDEVYLRHILVDAMARSNSHLTVLVLSSNDEDASNKDGSIGNVLKNWSEDIIEKITVKCTNKCGEQLWKLIDHLLIINEDCRKFIDRGVEKDFDKYRENLQFKIFHENNSIYKSMAFDLSKQVKNNFSEDISEDDILPEISGVSQSASSHARDIPKDDILPDDTYKHYILPEISEMSIPNCAILASYHNEKRPLLYSVDWTVHAVNGSHIWHDTSTSDECMLHDCVERQTDRISGPKKQCTACKLIAHEKCAESHIMQSLFKCRSTYREATLKDSSLLFHHIVCHRRVISRCDACGKSIQSKKKGFIASTCSWCKLVYHTSCSPKNMHISYCDFGKHENIILPPSWVVKLPSGKYSQTINKRGRISIHRHFNKERRAFVIKPVEVNNKVILLVFVNPRSGGNEGARILESYQYILNPRQVFDLSKDGPWFGLALFRNVPNIRILVCGGDGTVGWILSEIDKLKISPAPPVAILPLGIVNDLSRFLGWGSGYTDESLSEILTHVEKGVVQKLDRWSIDVIPFVFPPEYPLENEKDCEDNSVSKLPLTVMNKYFSMGADADVSLEFRESKESNSRLKSPLKNVYYYGKRGSKFKDLYKCIHSIFCDDMDLTQTIKDVKPICLIFLNISSYNAGTPWGNPTNEGFLQQKCDDGYLEIIALTSASMLATQVGGHGIRINQCMSAIINTITKVPMQLDGEPCRLNPSRIHIKWKNQANMIIKKKPHRSLYDLEERPLKITPKTFITKLYYLTINQYMSLVKYDIDEIKAVVVELCSMSIDPEWQLDEMRRRIEYMKETEDVFQSRLRDDWCFLDATWTVRIYRIDEAQETLLYLGDILEGGIFVLDLLKSHSSSSQLADHNHTIKRPSSVIDDELSMNCERRNSLYQSSSDREKSSTESESEESCDENISIPKDDDERISVFLDAAENGYIHQFKAIHEAGVNLTVCNSSGLTPLHLASKNGHKSIVTYIIDQVEELGKDISSSVIDLVDNKSLTPLHLAALHKKRTICRRLISGGASVTRQDTEGNTPQQLALKAQDAELAKYLEKEERLQLIAADDHETAV